MGGTKNREEKKKKAHVYSSGAAGGSNKGPAVVDKRNQTLECPHCDRTFQQVQRYREHIAKKHADSVQDIDDAASSCQDAAEAMPAQAGKMMQPGSKGGYFTDKSPKLLLLEWCQQQKRAKPRYKDLPHAGNLHKCRVVLPDPKGGDKDTVVFLDDAQAALSAEEAQERGAVAALARVAGHRNMQRVLPKPYQPAWEWCVKQEEERAAIKARAAAAAEQRKEREAGRRRALAMKTPATAVMTQQQRSRVEEVLAQLRNTQVAGGALSGDSDVVRQELQRLGFTETDAQTAVEAVGQASLPACLDWLCLHLPEEDLPPAFAPGAAGEPVGVLLSGKAGAANAALQDPAVAGLAQLGYSVPACMEALQRLKGNTDAAHMDLFARLTGIEATQVVHEETEGWSSEVAALQAVYEGMIAVLSPGCMCFETALPQDAGSGVSLKLQCNRQYPDQVPLISVRCQQMTARQVLYLTKQVSEAGRQAVGDSMLHVLIDTFTHILETLPANPQVPALPPASSSATTSHAQQHKSEAMEQGSRALKQPANDSIGSQKTAQGRAKPSAEQTQAENQQLVRQQRNLASDARHEKMRETRKRLPAYGKQQELLLQLQQCSVVIISGATGCGKSTQVPQYILEEAIQAGAGAACNCICTQPRRISAVGVSTRVAQEQGEGVGNVVGYSVRLESKTSLRTRLLFCTTGILLRRFLSDPDLEGVSHVIVDEVHERSLDTDLLLLLLRDLLAKGSPVKVILMSATADANLFAAYFAEGQKVSKVGMLSIPGLTHPVRDMYLEDVLENTHFKIGPGSKWARKQVAKAGPGATAQLGTAVEDWQLATYSDATRRSLAVVDESLVNYDLLEALVVHIVQAQAAHGPAAMLQDWDDAPQLAGMRADAQAILIFMPGAPEISRLVRQLESSAKLRQASQGRLRVLPLHGALPSHAQVKVFEQMPPDVRKIVVATNVAETSITIDDVGCVIDTGRVKAMSYDAERGISRLAEGWVSLAAAQQRRGRAGRVQPGACFKLFSQQQASLMQREQPPEVARTPLEQLCLTVKTRFGSTHKLGALLSRMLTPPPVAPVASAISSLTNLGALDAEEALTPLGRLLSQIPMDPRLAKTCIFACMLRCVDPILTIVAAMAHGRSVFVSPPDKRAEATAAKASLTAGSAAAKSDHLAIIAAFNAWSAAFAKGGRQHAHTFCTQAFLSEAALEAVEAGRADFAATLTDIGLLPASYQAQVRHSRSSAERQEPHAFDHFCNNARVIKAALCAGFYPSILRVDQPAAKYSEMHSGAFETDADPSKLRFNDKHKGRVFIHPGSINFNVGKFESGWVVYTDMVATSKLYVRESSAVPIYALLLFGGRITVQHEEGTLKLDGWATFKAPARIAVLVRELRLQVDQLMLAKVADTSLNMFDSPITGVMQDLLAKDGF